MQARPDDVFEFPPFRLEPERRRLSRDGEEISLTPKAFDVLVALVQGKGRIVRKQELLDTIWEGAFVEEAVLTQNVYTVRRALGDVGPTHRFIATVPRIGYRFIAPLHESSAAQTESDRLPRSIAVLPFDVLGGGEDVEWLGLGLADALITRLSGLPGLTVRPTSAVRPDTSIHPLSLTLR